VNDGDAAPARSRRTLALTLASVVLAWVWLLFGHLGDFGQSLAIVGPALYTGVVVLHAIAAAVRRRAIVLVAAVAWIASGAVMVLSPRTPVSYAAPRAPITLVAANLRFDNPTPEAAARAVIDRHADIVVVSEATDRSAAVLTGAYRYHARSDGGNDGYSELVVSRYPLHLRSGYRQMLAVDVRAPAPFELLAAHFPRAGYGLHAFRGHFNFGAQAQSVRVVDRLRADATLPVVLAGDLNVSDRTSTYRHLVARRRDAMRAGWAGPTFRLFPFSLLSLRIDHVIVDRDWCAAHARRFHPGGSDHESVQVTIGPCPA